MGVMATKKPVPKPRPNIVAPQWPDYGSANKLAAGCQHVLEFELKLFSLPRGSLEMAFNSQGKEVNCNTKGKPRWHHAKQVIDLLWNYQGSQKPFAWHPDALRMLKAACKHRRLGVAGAGSTGKSDFFAVWAIINWMTNPGPTVRPDGTARPGAMVVVTSTTKGAAANRIWGKIVSYWNGMIAPTCGKLMATDYMICYHDLTQNKTDKTAGIKLMAGEASQEAKSADELRGLKGDPFILIIDEMAECGHSLTNTFEENSTANYNNQLIGLANPGTYFDAFGRLCEPEAGYESVGDDDMEWVAKKGGYVIRLNAELSPNITEGRVVYPFLMQEDQLQKKIEVCGGRHTPSYYRGVLGMWCPTGNEETIYSQLELLHSHAFWKVGPGHKDVWRDEVTYVAGFDVAFTHEGDRSILTIGRVGYTVANKLTLEVIKQIEINEDTRVKSVDRTTQIVTKLRQECEKYGVRPENLALDASGPGGKAFRDAVTSQWSSKCLAIDFSGAPSDRQVSKTDKAKCKDRYDRRVSEVWFSAKSFLRGDQLRGIDPELADEMVIRKYKETKPATDLRKIFVETKKAMKARTQKSPDRGDSFMCLAELCRIRHKFVSEEVPADRKESGGGTSSPTKKVFKKFQDIYAAA